MADVLKKALSGSARLKAAVQPGKQALKGVDKPRVTESRAKITDSLALDDRYEPDHPQSHRWDYLVGVEASLSAECVYGIEVHHATPGEVRGVIARQQWARKTLHEECGKDPVHHWIWIASSSVGISKNTTESKMLQKAGIRLVGHLEIKGC